MPSPSESPSSSSMLPWFSNACRSFTSLRARQVTSTHLLRIEGYSTADRMVKQGEYIESSTFTAGGHKWRLRFFPNGYKSKYVPGYDGMKFVDGAASGVELRLMKGSNEDDVVAAYGLSVLDRDGEPALSYSVGPQRFNKASRYKHKLAVLATPEERQAGLRLMEDHDTLAVRCNCNLTVTSFDKESFLKWYLRKLLD